MAGVAVGAGLTLIAPAIVGLLLVAGILGYDQTIGMSRETAEPAAFLTIEGQDVSAAGGRRVMGELDRHSFRQDCRDTCDDIESEFGPVKRLRVLDASGDCVLCETKSGRRSDEAWRVGGTTELGVIRAEVR